MLEDCRTNIWWGNGVPSLPDLWLQPGPSEKLYCRWWVSSVADRNWILWSFSRGYGDVRAYVSLSMGNMGTRLLSGRGMLSIVHYCTALGLRCWHNFCFYLSASGGLQVAVSAR